LGVVICEIDFVIVVDVMYVLYDGFWCYCFVVVNGVCFYVVEVGVGLLVVLLHGFL